MICLIGCRAKENIPTYPELPRDDTLRRLAEQSRAVKNVSAEGTVKLTDAKGQSVRLDTAMVLKMPDHMRLRAWKFGQAVFDLTLTPDALYLVAPGDRHREQIERAGANAGKFARAWLKQMSSFFDRDDLQITSETRDWLVVQAPSVDGFPVVAKVDRRTLTVREYSIPEQNGRGFVMKLNVYKQFGNTVWPTEIEAVSPGGNIFIDLSDVEINGELPPDAFKPPARAEKLP